MPDSETDLVLRTDNRQTETELKVAPVPEAVKTFTHAGGRLVRGPFEIPIELFAVVSDPWENRLVMLNNSKGLLQVDENRNFIGVARTENPPDLPPSIADPVIAGALIALWFPDKNDEIMSTANTIIITTLDGAYSNSEPWYGPKLRQTLTGMTIEQLTYTDTYEGYSAWVVGLHCAYWKWVVRRGITAEKDEFPHAPEDFPRLRGQVTEEMWANDLRYMDEQHERRKSAAMALSDAALDAA